MATIEELKARRSKIDEQIKEKQRRFEQQVGAVFIKTFKVESLKEAKAKISELENLAKAKTEHFRTENENVSSKSTENVSSFFS